jgi:hypothetical protein
MEELAKELLKQLGYNTAPVIYAALAYGFFHWLDEKLSDEAKAALARTMMFKDYKNEQIASALVEVFDRIYTYPLRSWRTFFRSLLFTTVVSAIYAFEMGHLYGNVIAINRCAALGHAGENCVKAWMVLSLSALAWITALLFNVYTDYISLFMIRPLLIRSGTKPVISLALGAVSGAAIVLAANELRIRAHWVGMVLEPAPHATFPWGPPFWFHLFFAWPAMAVFVWLPLLALGIVVARLPTSWIVGRAQWFLKEGKEHPLKAIGYVAAVVVFLGTVAARAIFSAAL